MTMEKILGNFLTQANKDFPLDCETLDYMQKLTAFVSLVGNLGGDRVVLYGCEANTDGTRRSAGYVFVRTRSNPEGEVLPWEGGSTTSGMYLKQEDVSVSANNTDYPKAYTRRSLAPGIGAENYRWEDFTDIKSIRELMAENRELHAELAGLQPLPLGTVQMWAGSEVPEGYVLCNGQELRTTEYPELYKVLGSTFNTATSAGGTRYSTRSGYFRVPDLRGRFVVGQHDSDNDYRTCGSAGGSKAVALTTAQLPSHNHAFKDYYYPERHSQVKGNYDNIETNSKIGSSDTDYDNDCLQYYKHNTDNAGSGQTHENRPPYYVLAYIMRAR